MIENRQTSVVSIVRKLTSASISVTSTALTSTALTSAALLGLSFCGSAQAAADSWHDTQAIAATAERFIIQRSAGNSGETTVQAARIDSRHRLARCEVPLQPFLRRGSTIQARTIVGVRCSGEKPWKIYVPVDVLVSKAIVTTNKPLPRNHVLVAADLTTAVRDVSRLRAGYFTDRDAVIGQHLKAPLLGGQIIAPGMLQAALLIRRGQSVTLIVGTGQFSIRVRGVALADGAINQRIRVENSSSGRVVEGVVRSAEHVEILTSSNGHFLSLLPKDLPAMADTRHSNNDR